MSRSFSRSNPKIEFNVHWWRSQVEERSNGSRSRIFFKVKTENRSLGAVYRLDRVWDSWTWRLVTVCGQGQVKVTQRSCPRSRSFSRSNLKSICMSIDEVTGLGQGQINQVQDHFQGQTLKLIPWCSLKAVYVWDSWAGMLVTVCGQGQIKVKPRSCPTSRPFSRSNLKSIFTFIFEGHGSKSRSISQCQRYCSRSNTKKCVYKQNSENKMSRSSRSKAKVKIRSG